MWASYRTVPRITKGNRVNAVTHSPTPSTLILDHDLSSNASLLCAALTCAGTMVPAMIAGCSDGRRRDSSERCWRYDGCLTRTTLIVWWWLLYGANYC